MDLVSIQVAPHRGPRGKPESFKRALIEFYQQPNTLRGTAAKFGMSYGAARKIIVKGGALRPEYGSVSPETMKAIEGLWFAGKSQTEIGQVLGMSQLKVSRLMAKQGIAFERRSRGAKHGSWKGGRWIHGGYVRVWVDRSDPFFGMASRDGYCLEHRLAMARALGRALLPTETVHHIDGNPLNNALSNLQLRQGRHGRGVAMKCADCGSTHVVCVPLTAD